MRKSNPHAGGPAAVCAALAIVLLSPRIGRAQEVELDWRRGPATAPIGVALAEIELSENYVWLDGENSRLLMELLENPVSGTEVATIAPVSEEAMWYAVFEWSDIGYVTDDERDQLDPAGMLASIREGNAAGNELRAEKGWAPLEILGWHEQPHYDPKTNNLTWAILASSEGQQVINRNIRILGRRGVMELTLVASPDELAVASAELDDLLLGYAFRPGNRYAEFVPGSDRVAEVGLTALVVGGAGAMAVKSGLLARMWKFLVAGVVAAAAAIKRFFGRASGPDREPARG